MSTKTLTRTELYKLVWEKPLSKLAEQLEVKSAHLRKICLREDIPLPPSGYWIRKQFGKVDPTTPLWPRNKETLIDLQADKEAETEAPKYYPGENEMAFKVPAKLVDPDPMIKEAERALNRKGPNKWNGGIVHTEWNQLPIKVTKSNINRALRIMDTLLKCWRDRGYKIITETDDAYVYIREVCHRFSLREQTKKLPKQKEYDLQQYEATGLLIFRTDIRCGREWRDGKKPLEEQLFDITNLMEQAAQELEKIWAENKLKEEQRNQKILEEQNIALQKKLEHQKFDRLLDDAKRWTEAKILRDYLQVLEASYSSSPGFKEWLKWANEKVDYHDPLSNQSEKWNPKQ